MALVKPIARNDDYWLTVGDPDIIPPVEILDIKWTELYDKWGEVHPTGEESRVEKILR
jgi:hypothetical protein